MDSKFLTQYDNWIRNSILKKFGQCSELYLDDAVSEAHLWALKNPNDENIKRGMLIAAYRLVGKSIEIELHESNLVPDPLYIVDKKIANISKLPHFDKFFNSLTQLEQLIVECKIDSDYYLLPQVIIGKSAVYINTSYHLILKKYSVWVVEYINTIDKCINRIKLIKSPLLKQVATYITEGYRTSSIARQIGTTTNYAAQLVYIARRFMYGDSMNDIHSNRIPQQYAKRCRA